MLTTVLLVLIIFALLCYIYFLRTQISEYKEEKLRKEDKEKIQSERKPYSFLVKDTLEKLTSIYTPEGDLIIDGVYSSEGEDNIVVYDFTETHAKVFISYIEDLMKLPIIPVIDCIKYEDVTFRDFLNIAYECYPTRPDESVINEIKSKYANKFVGGLEAFQNPNLERT